MKKIQELDAFKLSEFTKKALVTVSPETTIRECQQLLKNEGIHHLPVVEGERAVGMISDRDVMVISNAAMAEKYTAQDIMGQPLYQVSIETALSVVVATMVERSINAVVICEQQKPQGIFTSTDALNLLHQALGIEVKAQEKQSIILF